MPWCDDCDRFLNPNTVRDDGTCPTCGRRIIAPNRLQRARQGRGSSADAVAVRAGREQAAAPGTPRGGPADPGSETPTTPWHFKLLLVALVLYLGWRLVEGIVWVAQRF